MKLTVWIAVLFVSVVVGTIAVSSFRSKPHRCRVCITFHGLSNCGTASADTEADAQRTAAMTACAQLSSGVTESNQCENTRPDSVDWLK